MGSQARMLGSVPILTISNGTVNGTFDTINLPSGLPDGVSWNTDDIYTTGKVRLQQAITNSNINSAVTAYISNASQCCRYLWPN